MNTPYLIPQWEAPPNIRAVTTTRNHLLGHSKGTYGSFNLGLHVGDNSAHVKANRRLLAQELKLRQEPFWLNQVHGNRCIRFEQGDDNQADAIVSQKMNQVCAIMTADCLPILLCNKEGSEVAAIHGGWRSLCQGIIANTLQQMESEPQQMMAWLGPCISQQAFEVGAEVYQQFCRIDPIYAEAFDKINDKYLASLANIATIQLNKLQVYRVSSVNQCTFHSKNDFFSYRRNGQTGRMASLIWIA